MFGSLPHEIEEAILSYCDNKTASSLLSGFNFRSIVKYNNGLLMMEADKRDWYINLSHFYVHLERLDREKTKGCEVIIVDVVDDNDDIYIPRECHTIIIGNLITKYTGWLSNCKNVIVLNYTMPESLVDMGHNHRIAHSLTGMKQEGRYREYRDIGWDFKAYYNLYQSQNPSTYLFNYRFLKNCELLMILETETEIRIDNRYELEVWFIKNAHRRQLIPSNKEISPMNYPDPTYEEPIYEINHKINAPYVSQHERYLLLEKDPIKFLKMHDIEDLVTDEIIDMLSKPRVLSEYDERLAAFKIDNYNIVKKMFNDMNGDAGI